MELVKFCWNISVLWYKCFVTFLQRCLQDYVRVLGSQVKWCVALHWKRVRRTLWLEHAAVPAHWNAQCLELWAMISYDMLPARCWSVATWLRCSDSVDATCRPMLVSARQPSLADDQQAVATRCATNLVKHWQHLLPVFVAVFRRVAARRAWPGLSIVQAPIMCLSRRLCSILVAAYVTHHHSSSMKWKPALKRSPKKSIRQPLNSRCSSKEPFYLVSTLSDIMY